jgi:hypothetical protein
LIMQACLLDVLQCRWMIKGIKVNRGLINEGWGVLGSWMHRPIEEWVFVE